MDASNGRNHKQYRALYDVIKRTLCQFNANKMKSTKRPTKAMQNTSDISLTIMRKNRHSPDLAKNRTYMYIHIKDNIYI